MKPQIFCLYASAAVAVALVAKIGYAQVDLSCIGVQAMSLHEKILRLGNQSAIYAPVMAKVDQLQILANNVVKPVEKQWDSALKEAKENIEAANPGLTQAEINSMLKQRVRQSAELDNKQAELFIAQLKAHKFEEQMIIAAHGVPDQNNSQQVSELSQQYAKSKHLSEDHLLNIQRSPTLQRLIGTLAASEYAAKSSSDIPAAPLARIGFESPADGQLVMAIQAASNLIAEADARRTGATLVVSHLGRLLGSPEDRAATMNAHQSATARVTNSQIGTGLNRFQVSTAIMEGLRSIKLDQIKVPNPEPTAPQPKTWGNEVATAVIDQVNSIRRAVLDD